MTRDLAEKLYKHWDNNEISSLNDAEALLDAARVVWEETARTQTHMCHCPICLHEKDCVTRGKYESTLAAATKWWQELTK